MKTDTRTTKEYSDDKIQEKYYDIVMENRLGIAEIKNDIAWIKKALLEMKETNANFNNNFVSKEEFKMEIAPLKKFMYTIIGAVCLAVLAGILDLVIKR